MWRNLIGKTNVHLILIAAVGLIVYSNTFDVPFQWDEEFFIRENPIVKDLSYFIEPSKAKGLEYYGALKNRYVGYFTFALNYKLNGLDVMGYHIFNLTVHLLNAILVYFLVSLTFRTPVLQGSKLSERSGYISLFTGLLFVSHPIQTEAVTYIFQRLASLAAFFYLLTLVLYIKWRESQTPFNKSHTMLYLFSLLSAVLAMKTKENAFTLSLAVVLYEFLFFEGKPWKRFLPLVPFLLTMPVIPLSLVGLGKPVWEVIAQVSSATKHLTEISPMSYLFTQFRVIVTYIRLLFLPVGQNFNYDPPVYNSFFDPKVLASFLFLASLLGIGVYLVYRSRKANAGFSLIAFGIFWFFLTISVESSLLPIPVIMCEYRLYLPSAGFFLAAVSALAIIPVKSKTLEKIFLPVMLGITVVLSGATYARNALWKDGVTLWEDAVNKSPLEPIGHFNLGNAYREVGLKNKAIEQYQITIKIRPDDAEAHNNLGLVYESIALYDEAARYYKRAIEINPVFDKPHFNLGAIYLHRGMLNDARRELEKALQLNPNHSRARLLLDSIANAAEQP